MFSNYVSFSFSLSLFLTLYYSLSFFLSFFLSLFLSFFLFSFFFSANQATSSSQGSQLYQNLLSGFATKLLSGRYIYQADHTPGDRQGINLKGESSSREKINIPERKVKSRAPLTELDSSFSLQNLYRKRKKGKKKDQGNQGCAHASPGAV